MASLRIVKIQGDIEMPSPSDRSASDYNLLFGILALQMNFITRDELVEGMHTWVLDKTKLISEVLFHQKRLSIAQIQALDSLIAERIKLDGGDIQRSIHALPAASLARSSLEFIEDGDLQAALANTRLKEDDSATGMYIPSPTGNGIRFLKRKYHNGGGLGDVYYAEDTELNREVALKEIKPKHADNLSARARFLIEAEITGGLEHPGIVPVYGLGTCSDGRPHYAMRFIRGQDLKNAIESFHSIESKKNNTSDYRLAYRQLLGRFIDVCYAVGYAHSRGVVHRDLKPANVMLGKFGETLVIDWGLAKAGVEPTRPAQDASLEPMLKPLSGSDGYSKAGSITGTVLYMSPEQAKGKEISSASDIYSLGSTLYKLLVNRTPYESNDAKELLAKVQHGQFKPPREIQSSTPAGLDAICCKAMAYKPEDRYPTALALAADLEHWLADEPVSAYPDPPLARAGRWARRHRSLVVGSGVFLLAAVAALSVITFVVSMAKRETEKQRLIAVENYELSRTQAFDIIKLIEETEPEMAMVPTFHDHRKKLLTTSAEACRQFLVQEPDDTRLQERSAKIFRYAGNFHRLTYEMQEAERYYKDSIALSRRLIDTDSVNTNYSALLADVLRDHAILRFRRGELVQAVELLEESLEISERLSHQRRIALALGNLAQIEYRHGKHEKTGNTPGIQRCEELLRTLANNKATAHPYDPLLLSNALLIVAMMERSAGRIEIAEAKQKEALSLLRELLLKKSKLINDTDVEVSMAVCQIEIAKAAAKSGKPRALELGQSNLGTAINKLVVVAKDYPKIPLYKEIIAEAYLIRGELFEQTKDFTKAGEHYEEANTRYKALAESYDLPDLKWELGKAFYGKGRIAAGLGKTEEAEMYKKALELVRAAGEQTKTDLQIRRSAEEIEKRLGRE